MNLTQTSLTGLFGVLALSLTFPAVAQEIPPVRIATFNTSLSPNLPNELIEALSITPDNPLYDTNPLTIQARQVAEIIQRIDPDIILLNEFNYNPENPTGAAVLFQQNFLSVGQNISGNPRGPANPINFNEFYVGPGKITDPFNTGIFSGYDLNTRNGGAITSPPPIGTPEYANDSWGFGFYPGQYGMVVYSKYPILEEQARTFGNFLWQDMPDNLLPTDWYSPEVAAQFPLSSKSHWDLPIDVDGTIIHILASHPTPPTFDDGQDDRNGRRNHDEIRLWADYITPGQGDYICDDLNNCGGLTPGSKFVIMGDQNADPNDGDSTDGAINQLLDNPLVNTSKTPSSLGGKEYSLNGSGNPNQNGNPAYDTAVFVGGLRVDYVLPSDNLKILDAQVFWPTENSPLASLNLASDHRAVYVDVVPEPLTLLGAGCAVSFGAFFKRKFSQKQK
ncbi:Endonuclease/exonuclease/phosphatase [Gloeothece citriformis PCC 7424]|uniref:Endonuclease/exonuclease/phosphatase n=1 Tax=Gloeothece citriformis (strain PCC 7424) TaxID=65393 RepID=B7KIB5_GLOC7|nr:PEP-CTERM sorting domain-containing protein [Gloeothece citriformis]ACK73602.1 Endonuclease/exonuclease/phosphatase [Gloeothece citriformis PCC 7424]